MTLPLNIDFQQVLLHLLNFVILAGGLYLLLYKPVKKFMEARTAKYAEEAAKAEEAVAAAEKLKADYEARLADSEKEIARKQAEASRQAAEQAQQRIQEAQKQAEQILSESRKTAETEKKAIVDGAREELVQLAMEAARKIVLEPDDAYASFADAVRSGEAK